MKKATPLVASVLAVVLLVGCVNIGVLITLGTQIAINIIQIISAFQGHADVADIAAAQNIGNEASKDWQDVVTAYNTHQANKVASNLQNVVNAGSILENDLSTILIDAHIKNPVLASRIEVAISTMITVVDSIAADLGATIPVTRTTARFKGMHLGAIAAGNVKAQHSAIVTIWNSQVLAPTGMTDVDSALAHSRLQ